MNREFKAVDTAQLYEILKLINKAVLSMTNMMKCGIKYIEENKSIYIEKLKIVQYYIISLSEKMYYLTELSINNFKYFINEAKSWIK